MDSGNDQIKLRPDGISDDVGVYSSKKIMDICGGRRLEDVVRETMEALAQPKSAAWQMRILRRNAKIHCDAYVIWTDLLDQANREIARLKGGQMTHHRKQWTKGEDEALVEMASRDDVNVSELSAMFGRTPQAIASHLSDLVGIQRTKQTVLGHFIGTIGGARVEGDAEGTVYLVKRAEEGENGK